MTSEIWYDLYIWSLAILGALLALVIIKVQQRRSKKKGRHRA